MKKLLILLLLLVVVVAVGAHFGAAALLKSGVEKGGSLALDTDVHVHGASLSLLSGKVGLKGVHIHNPEGFQTDDAFSVKKIQVNADVKSLLDEVVEIREINIRRPEVTLELTQNGTNINRLLQNLESKDSASGEPSESGKKFRVGKVVITKAQVKVAQTVLLKNELQLELPTIELTDLGGEKDPLTLAELIELILGAILTNTEGVSGLPTELANVLDKEASRFLDDVKKQIGQQLDNHKSKATDAVEKLQEDVKKELGKGLDDLLGNKKKKN